MIDADFIKQRFEEVFLEVPGIIARSPGRINIIGEHTDYHEGFVLPAAIDRFIYVAAAPRSDNTIRLYSDRYNEYIETTLDGVRPNEKSWGNYILGVVHELLSQGHSLAGFDLVFAGDIPIGAGLSSSAAVECATVLALDTLFSYQISKVAMAKIGQQAEHKFAGVRCGIMDQFASMLSKEGTVIKLDCRTLDFEYKPLELGDFTFLLINSNVDHSLADSAYNDRREKSEQGVSWIREKYPQVKSLRDVSILMLQEIVEKRDIEVFLKCKYVIEENERLLQACTALENGDLATLGDRMYASHRGLSEQYDVSCKELDFLVAQAKLYPQVLGARMMGGGFGGCTINLIHQDFKEEFVAKIEPLYRKHFDIDITPIQINIGGGAEILYAK